MLSFCLNVDEVRILKTNKNRLRVVFIFFGWLVGMVMIGMVLNILIWVDDVI